MEPRSEAGVGRGNGWEEDSNGNATRAGGRGVQGGEGVDMDWPGYLGSGRVG